MRNVVCSVYVSVYLYMRRVAVVWLLLCLLRRVLVKWLLFVLAMVFGSAAMEVLMVIHVFQTHHTIAAVEVMCTYASKCPTSARCTYIMNV